jgi:hypothetical protein
MSNPILDRRPKSLRARDTQILRNLALNVLSVVMMLGGVVGFVSALVLAKVGDYSGWEAVGAALLPAVVATGGAEINHRTSKVLEASS